MEDEDTNHDLSKVDFKIAVNIQKVELPESVFEDPRFALNVVHFLNEMLQARIGINASPNEYGGVIFNIIPK